MASNQQKAFPIGNGKTPPDTVGGRAYSYTFDFPTFGPSIATNINIVDIGLDNVQSVFIDNSNNPDEFYLGLQGTGQLAVLPPYSQGFIPLLFPGNFLGLTCKTSGNVAVTVQFLNIEMALAIWSTTAPGSVTGTVTVTGTVIAQPFQSSFVNRSGSITTGGTAQNLAGANGSRRRLIVANPITATGQGIGAAEYLYINFTTAAGINDGVSFELAPGGVFDTGNGPVTTELVSVIAQTSGHRFIAREM